MLEVPRKPDAERLQPLEADSQSEGDSFKSDSERGAGTKTDRHKFYKKISSIFRGVNKHKKLK